MGYASPLSRNFLAWPLTSPAGPDRGRPHPQGGPNVTQAPRPRSVSRPSRLPISSPVLRSEVRLSGSTGGEPSLHYAAELVWLHSQLPPALSRRGFTTLEEVAECAPPWVSAWEAIDQWRQLGYLHLPPDRHWSFE